MIGHELLYRQWTRLEHCPQPLLTGGQSDWHAVRLALTHGEPAIVGSSIATVELPTQDIENLGILMTEQAERHGATRTDLQHITFTRANLAVTADTDGVHGNRLHHGAPASNHCPIEIQRRPAILQQCDIRGGATDVHHIGVKTLR